jgi:hypothetical protein
MIFMHLPSKHLTKNMRGLEETARRRPYKPDSNMKSLYPHWMGQVHTFDRLNWIRHVRKDYKGNPEGYRAALKRTYI